MSSDSQELIKNFYNIKEVLNEDQEIQRSKSLRLLAGNSKSSTK